MCTFIDISHQISDELNSDDSKKFCFFCNKVPNVKETLKEHISWHMKYKPIKCKTCKSTFESQRLFESHCRKALKERRSPCAQSYSKSENVWIEGMVDIMTSYSQNIGRGIIRKRMAKNPRVFMVDEIGGYLCDILAGRPVEDDVVVNIFSGFLATGGADSSLFRQAMENLIAIWTSILKKYERSKSKVTKRSGSKNKDVEEDNTAKNAAKEVLFRFADANRLDDLEFKALEHIKDNCYMCDENYSNGNLKIQHIIEKHMRLRGFQPFLCQLCNDRGNNALFASVDLFGRHLRTQHPNEYKHYESTQKDSSYSLEKLIIVDDKHHDFANKYNNTFLKCFRQNSKRKCPAYGISDCKKSKIIVTDEGNEGTSQANDADSADLLGDILGDIRKTPCHDKVETPKVSNNISKQKKNKSVDFIEVVEYSPDKNDIDVPVDNIDKPSNLGGKSKTTSSGKGYVHQKKSATDAIVKEDGLLSKRENLRNHLAADNCSKKKPFIDELNNCKGKKIPVKSTSNKIGKAEVISQRSPFLRRKSTAYNGYVFCIQQCGSKCERCDKPVMRKSAKVVCCENKPWYLDFRTPFWYLLSSSHINSMLESTNIPVFCQLCSKEFDRSGRGMIKHVIEKHLSLKGFLLKCRLCNLEANDITGLICHWDAVHYSTGISFSNNLVWRCPSISMKYPDNYSIEVNKDSALKIEKYVRKFVGCFPLVKTQLSVGK
uniref:C2H2-type domain-containing protein n=1 Tax=Strongyloides venezuelensis TaxID=75913 RepID=A0A0K0F8L2_STRVS